MCTFIEVLWEINEVLHREINEVLWELLMRDILRQSVVSATLSGMQLHASQNHAILRFKNCFGLILRNCMTKSFIFNGTFKMHGPLLIFIQSISCRQQAQLVRIINLIMTVRCCPG
jgi:hypothetical protein